CPRRCRACRPSCRDQDVCSVVRRHTVGTTTAACGRRPRLRSAPRHRVPGDVGRRGPAHGHAERLACRPALTLGC
ncbi:MAG: hypothetical protein AVDCRST_MAG16-2977, partial [uncultured Frankineae bacterium]